MNDNRDDERQVLEALARAVAPLVLNMVRVGLESEPPKPRLYTLKECGELGYDVGWLTWQVRSKRVELVKAGALVEGNPHRIDPRLVEEVASGRVKPAAKPRELKRAS